MGKGAFFDTGAGATWAEALLFPPWIADERDGTIFRNLPAIRFKQALDASEGRPDAPGASNLRGQ